MGPWISGIFSLLGVFLAAWLVVAMAVRRIRKERAFDRRLNWCESIMRELNNAGAAVVTAANQSGHHAIREACWRDAFQAYELLIPLCAQKELYATESAIIAILDFMKAFKALIELHLQSHDHPQMKDASRVCVGKLQTAAETLAGEARKHLGMKPLQAGLIRTEHRFFGSIRGMDAGHLADDEQHSPLT